VLPSIITPDVTPVTGVESSGSVLGCRLSRGDRGSGDRIACGFSASCVHSVGFSESQYRLLTTLLPRGRHSSVDREQGFHCYENSDGEASHEYIEDSLCCEDLGFTFCDVDRVNDCVQEII